MPGIRETEVHKGKSLSHGEAIKKEYMWDGKNKTLNFEHIHFEMPNRHLSVYVQEAVRYAS